MTAAPRRVDLHSHLLPAVDDGPRDLEESLAMLRRAHEDGTRRLAATPHMFSPIFPNVDRLVAKAAFAALSSRLAEERAKPEGRAFRELEIVLGAECFVGSELFEALDAGDAPSLNGSRYLLVELSPFFGSSACEAALNRVLDHGLVPLVAHVERVLGPREARSIAARWVDLGALLQVNVQSLLEGYRSSQRGTCIALLEKRLVHVIASDAHDVSRRPPLLAAGFRALERRFGAEYANLLMVENPARILDDREVSTVPGGSGSTTGDGAQSERKGDTP